MKDKPSHYPYLCWASGLVTLVKLSQRRMKAIKMAHEQQSAWISTEIKHNKVAYVGQLSLRLMLHSKQNYGNSEALMIVFYAWLSYSCRSVVLHVLVNILTHWGPLLLLCCVADTQVLWEDMPSVQSIWVEVPTAASKRDVVGILDTHQRVGFVLYYFFYFLNDFYFFPL